jgi:hypothetical protein
MIAAPEFGGMAGERVDWHMRNWVRWMHTGHLADGYPETACGCVGGGYSTSFEDMCESADAAAAEAVGALIESLTPIEGAAVNHRYLRAVYRFPRGNYDTALMSAMDSIGAGLVRRGFY